MRAAPSTRPRQPLVSWTLRRLCGVQGPRAEGSGGGRATGTPQPRGRDCATLARKPVPAPAPGSLILCSPAHAAGICPSDMPSCRAQVALACAVMQRSVHRAQGTHQCAGPQPWCLCRLVAPQPLGGGGLVRPACADARLQCIQPLSQLAARRRQGHGQPGRVPDDLESLQAHVRAARPKHATAG